MSSWPLQMAQGPSPRPFDFLEVEFVRASAFSLIWMLAGQRGDLGSVRACVEVSLYDDQGGHLTPPALADPASAGSGLHEAGNAGRRPSSLLTFAGTVPLLALPGTSWPKVAGNHRFQSEDRKDRAGGGCVPPLRKRKRKL